MKISCPHCRQHLEVDEAWAGLEVTCPSCGGGLVIPQPQEEVPPASVSNVPPPRTNTHLKAWKRRKLLRRVLLLLIAVAGLAAAILWFNAWRGEMPPVEALRHLAERCVSRAREVFAPAPAASPSPTPTPAATPAPSATPVPTPEATPAAPEVDPVAWLIEHPRRWPKVLVLKEEVEFPAVSGGKIVGRIKVPAGSTVDVIQITSADIGVEFRKGAARVPHAATNLQKAAAEEMARPEPTPAPTPTIAPVVQSSAPQPAKPAPQPARDELGAVLNRDKDGRVSGVNFRVWAPNVKSMDVIGSFNRWRPQANRLTKDEETGIWSCKVDRARPGDEYMFLIDGELEKRDPRAREISASGKCVIYDSAAFDWGSVADWKPNGNLDDLVIYELHPGTFYDSSPNDGRGATLSDAARKLDHLKDMGVNCVQLMPVTEFAGEHSWGYNPTDLFAVESSYGGPDALKEFVKAAHERGIKVHVDIVHNHYDQESPLWQFEGGARSESGGVYFYEDKAKARTPWGPRPDFGRREVRNFIMDQVRMWFDEYKIDGLRWDSTVNIRRYAHGEEANPDGEKLIDEASRMIRKEYPGRVSIAEDSVGDTRFDASWEYAFHHEDENRNAVLPQLIAERADVGDVARRVDSPLGLRRVIYTESHDEAGVLNGKQRLVMDADPADALSLKARRKHALGAVLTLTSPGIPFIFMGQELLETESFSDTNPLDWRRGEISAGATRLYRDLVRLRRNLDGRSTALKETTVRVTEADNGTGLLAYRRTSRSRPQDDLFVVINFSPNVIKDFPLYFPRTGEWKVLLNTDDTKYGKDFTGVTTKAARTDTLRKIPVTLAPFSAQIFGLSNSQNLIADPEDEPLEQTPAASATEPAPTAAPAGGMAEDSADQNTSGNIPEPAQDAAETPAPPQEEEYLVPSQSSQDEQGTPESDNY